MRQMQQGVHAGSQSNSSLAHPFGREAVFMRNMWPQILAKLISHHSHENSLGRTTLCVSIQTPVSDFFLSISRFHFNFDFFLLKLQVLSQSLLGFIDADEAHASA